jgi:hypothetical protein
MAMPEATITGIPETKKPASASLDVKKMRLAS